MIFLSFDIEEFDNPFPCTQNLSFDEQMEISKKGTERILNLLAEKNVKATFFCTANFALHAQNLIARMVAEGHEVASHGYYHNRFEEKHLKEAKEALEQLIGKPVTGFRMPNMGKVAPETLIDAGYSYSSSLNPTFLPGKYNNLSQPRRIFKQGRLYQIPVSVSPMFRIPLFWLSLHNFPLFYYKFLAGRALKTDGYINLYYHPWEFVDLKTPPIKLPFYVTRNAGKPMASRLGEVISYFQKQNEPFGCLQECPALFLKK